MFLAETVMGREHHIIRDDFSLRQPPSGQYTASPPSVLHCLLAIQQHRMYSLEEARGAL